MSDIKDCFRSLFTESRELLVPRRIERVSFASLSPLLFLRDYVAVNKPVIITDAIDHWAALQQWQDIEYLRQTAGNTLVSINTTPHGRGDCIIDDLFVKPYEIQRPFGHFLNYLTKPHLDPFLPGVAYLSHQNDSLRKELPLLLSDIDPNILPFGPEVFGGKPDAINLWIGDEHAESALHKDPYENLYAVVRGVKIFTLLPPTDHPFLCEKKVPSASFKYEDQTGWIILCETDQPITSWIPIDVDQDEHNFPVQSPAVKVSVHAGEVLFLPALWYHKVEQEGITIAANAWYDMKYDSRWVYHQFLKSLTSMANSDESCSGTPERGKSN